MSEAHTDLGSIYVEHIVKVQGRDHALRITAAVERGASCAVPPAAELDQEGAGEERKVATLRLPKPAWRQLKTLAMDLETSEQKLLALGMNLVFRVAGLPELAEEPFPEGDLGASRDFRKR